MHLKTYVLFILDKTFSIRLLAENSYNDFDDKKERSACIKVKMIEIRLRNKVDKSFSSNRLVFDFKFLSRLRLNKILPVYDAVINYNLFICVY